MLISSSHASTHLVNALIIVKGVMVRLTVMKEKMKSFVVTSHFLGAMWMLVTSLILMEELVTSSITCV